MNKIKKYAQKVLLILYVFITLSIVLSLLLNSNFDYESKQLVNTIINLLIAGVLIIIIMFIKSINYSFNKKTYLLLFIIVLAIQMYIFSSILFKTGWDSMFILDDSTALRDKQLSLISFDYYKTYPNNTLLFLIYYGIACFLKIFGITAKRYIVLNIVLINSVISNIACLLVYKIVLKHTNNKYALISYVLSIFLIALSPWNVVCYSDELALIIPIVVLYIYDFVENKYKKALIISLLCFIGYALKPQSIIIIIAVIITTLFSTNRNNIKEKIFKLTIGILIVFSCFLIKDYISSKLGFVRNRDKELGLSHYVMMGLNKETYGTYNQLDAESSINCETKFDRNAYNLKLIKQRLNSFDNGLDYINFLSKKIVVTFNDGSFSWWKEGDFYIKDYSFDLPFSKNLKDFYYGDGSFFEIYVNFVQIIWFIALLGCLFIPLLKEKNNITYIIVTALIGIVLFQIIFETRARYLYSNIPLFIIASMISVYSLQSKIINK